MPADNESWAERQVNDALRKRRTKQPSEIYHVHLPEKVRTRFGFEHVGYMGSRQVWRCSYCHECIIFDAPSTD